MDTVQGRLRMLKSLTHKEVKPTLSSVSDTDDIPSYLLDVEKTSTSKKPQLFRKSILLRKRRRTITAINAVLSADKKILTVGVDTKGFSTIPTLTDLEKKLVVTVNIISQCSSITEKQFQDFSSLTNVNVNSGSVLESIGNYAFYNCKKLKTITHLSLYSDKFGMPLTDIGDFAFYGCSSLISVFPNLIKFTLGSGTYNNSINRFLYVGRAAFYGCTSLKSLSLRFLNYLYLDDSSFSYCTKLVNIDFTLTKNIDLEDRVFFGCKKLNIVDYIQSTNLNSVSSTYYAVFDNCPFLKIWSILLPSLLQKVEYGDSYDVQGLQVGLYLSRQQQSEKLLGDLTDDIELQEGNFAATKGHLHRQVFYSGDPTPPAVTLPVLEVGVKSRLAIVSEYALSIFDASRSFQEKPGDYILNAGTASIKFKESAIKLDELPTLFKSVLNIEDSDTSVSVIGEVGLIITSTDGVSWEVERIPLTALPPSTSDDEIFEDNYLTTTTTTAEPVTTTTTTAGPVTTTTTTAGPVTTTTTTAGPVTTTTTTAEPETTTSTTAEPETTTSTTAEPETTTSTTMAEPETTTSTTAEPEP